jgi:hypothetical protein
MMRLTNIFGGYNCVITKTGETMSNKDQFKKLLEISSEEFLSLERKGLSFGYDDWCAAVIDFPEAQSLLEEKNGFSSVMDWKEWVSDRDPENQRETILKSFASINGRG